MAKVLVVDDYSVTQRVLSHILRRGRHDVVIAGTAEESLAQFDYHDDIDVAILDLMLPDMDGITLLSHIRVFAPDLPVIMLTASGQEEDRILAQAQGVDAFLTKPTSSNELLNQVSKLLTAHST